MKPPRLTDQEQAQLDAHALRRNYCTVQHKPDAHGWLKGEYCTRLGVVVVQGLFKAQADGTGYCYLKMIAGGQEYVFQDHTHRTRTQLVRLCSRFANEVQQRAAARP